MPSLITYQVLHKLRQEIGKMMNDCLLPFVLSGIIGNGQGGKYFAGAIFCCLQLREKAGRRSSRIILQKGICLHT